MAFFLFPVTRRAPRGPRVADADRAYLPVIILAILGMSYNAVLAVVNAHVTSVNFSTAAVVEITILSVGILMALRTGISKNEKNVLYFFATFIVLTLYISMMNERIFVDGLRNMLLITVFTVLGRQANEETVKKLFVWSTIIVLGFLIVELSSLETYAEWFKPALYFANSRGIAEFEYDETGLFRNTMGFEGRFTYGIFTGPRTSSLFLEQVSLANYAAVLCILLIALWPRLSIKERILHAGTMVLILVSNNTRATSLLVLASLAGYWIYPKLPRYANAVMAPIFIVLGIVAYNLYPNWHEDDFVGRTSMTGRHLTDMAPQDYFGLGLDQLDHLWDSGYPWLATATSVFGLITFWLFVSFVIPQKTPEQKRCSYAVSLYIFMNMLVSGNAIFSIKVSAALWILVGFVSGSKFLLPATRSAVDRRVAPAPPLGQPTAYAQTVQPPLRAK